MQNETSAFVYAKQVSPIAINNKPKVSITKKRDVGVKSLFLETITLNHYSKNQWINISDAGFAQRKSFLKSDILRQLQIASDLHYNFKQIRNKQL